MPFLQWSPTVKTESNRTESRHLLRLDSNLGGDGVLLALPVLNNLAIPTDRQYRAKQRETIHVLGLDSNLRGDGVVLAFPVLNNLAIPTDRQSRAKQREMIHVLRLDGDLSRDGVVLGCGLAVDDLGRDLAAVALAVDDLGDDLVAIALGEVIVVVPEGPRCAVRSERTLALPDTQSTLTGRHP